MAIQGAAGENPFDLGRIRQLVKLMRDNDLSEIDLRWDTGRLRLCRGAMGTIYSSITPPAPTVVEARPPAASAGTAEAPPAPATDLVTITSPIVGTFYLSSAPDAEPFVKVGTKVTADTVVCIVEAMKVFNEITARCGGTIAEVLVANGSPVEYGQPLFHVKP